MKTKFLVEFLDLPGSDPLEFDDEAEMQAHVDFIKSCPIDDPKRPGKFTRAKLKITELGEVKVKRV